jgi:hypothetical protein
MERIVSTRALLEALKVEGFPIPDHCREARLVMGVNEAFLIQFDVFLTNENLAKLGRALQRIGEMP